MGLVAPRHVGSSRTGAWTRVSCIGRRILNHCATRETLCCHFLKRICEIIQAVSSKYIFLICTYLRFDFCCLNGYFNKIIVIQLKFLSYLIYIICLLNFSSWIQYKDYVPILVFLLILFMFLFFLSMRVNSCVSHWYNGTCDPGFRTHHPSQSFEKKERYTKIILLQRLKL